jgi:hypothetical protein
MCHGSGRRTASHRGAARMARRRAEHWMFQPGGRAGFGRFVCKFTGSLPRHGEPAADLSRGGFKASPRMLAHCSIVMAVMAAISNTFASPTRPSSPDRVFMACLNFGASRSQAIFARCRGPARVIRGILPTSQGPDGIANRPLTGQPGPVSHRSSTTAAARFHTFLGRNADGPGSASPAAFGNELDWTALLPRIILEPFRGMEI